MQKTIIFSTLAFAASLAAAQEQARVLSATPIVQQVSIPQQVCANEILYSDARPTGAGAVLGAVAGGATGNAIGHGNGRAAATAIGVIGGALLGNQIESNGRPAQQNVQRCTTETRYENRTVGYNVVYEFAGRQYTTRTQNDPGEWIQVTVQPVANNPGKSYSTQPEQPYYAPPAPQNGYTPAPPPYSYYQAAPMYVTPPVTLELGYQNFRSDYPRHPHWRDR